MLDTINDHFRDGSITKVSVIFNAVKSKGAGYGDGHGYYVK
jgi:hypothetical protein